jgi:hypothetical protein
LKKFIFANIEKILSKKKPQAKKNSLKVSGKQGKRNVFSFGAADV